MQLQRSVLMSNCSWMTPKIIDPLHLSLIPFFCYMWTSSTDHSSNLNRHSVWSGHQPQHSGLGINSIVHIVPINSWCTDINSSLLYLIFLFSLSLHRKYTINPDRRRTIGLSLGCLHQLPYLPISTHTDSVVRGNGARCRLASWAIRYFPCKVPQTHRFSSGAAICGSCDSEFCSRALDQNWAANHQFFSDWLASAAETPGPNVLKEEKHKRWLNCA